MSRFIGGLSLAIVFVFVLSCLGLFVPLQVAYFLVAGWGHYLYRVLPGIQVDQSARSPRSFAWYS